MSYYVSGLRSGIVNSLSYCGRLNFFTETKITGRVFSACKRIITSTVDGAVNGAAIGSMVGASMYVFNHSSAEQKALLMKTVAMGAFAYLRTDGVIVPSACMVSFSAKVLNTPRLITDMGSHTLRYVTEGMVFTEILHGAFFGAVNAAVPSIYYDVITRKKPPEREDRKVGLISRGMAGIASHMVFSPSICWDAAMSAVLSGGRSMGSFLGVNLAKDSFLSRMQRETYNYSWRHLSKGAMEVFCIYAISQILAGSDFLS